MQDQLPRISLASALSGDRTAMAEVAAAVDASLQRLGFFIITDHGVPAASIDAIMAASRGFFDQSMDVKDAIRSSAFGSHRGYIATGVEALAHTLGNKTPPDLKESFGMGPPSVTADRSAVAGVGPTYQPNQWPAAPAAFKPSVLAFYQEMEQLTDVLMEVFAAALDIEPGYFHDRFQDHNSTFRIAHYPPLAKKPEPGQLRAGAHTDYGALTILLGENTPGGLEVLTPEGEWVPAKTSAHNFVVNIGDLMQTWSNDRWRSSEHRVANPPPEAWPGISRVSLAYFCNPDDALEIACLPGCASADNPPRYAPATAGELRHRKITAAKAAVE